MTTGIGIAALLLLQPILSAQENGHSSRAATRSTQGTDTRNNANNSSRPATDLERALSDLRRAQTIAAATLSSQAAYGLGDEARRTLLDVLREKTITEATFQGIVGVFEFERDPSIIPVLIDVYGADPARDRYLNERFKAFDAQRPMLEELFSALEKARDGRRRTLLRVCAEIIDTPPERMQASRFLIQAFQKPEFQGCADDLSSTLQKITWQRFSQPAGWQKWYDEFAPSHSEGFTEADLYQAAINDRDQRFIAEVKRSINLAIANKQIPDYFNQTQYPEPQIRAHAAAEFVALKDADADVLRQAVKVLIEALKLEKNEDVTCAVLKALGVLSENKDEVKEEVVPHLLGYLNDERDNVVVAALKALAQSGTGSDCHVVEELYARPETSKMDRSSVRAQVVTTLYSLDCGSPTILTALQDSSPEVRASAARGLGYGKRKDAAPRIAVALREEKSEKAQQAMVRALLGIQSWPADVIDALLEVAAKPGPVRDSAVLALIQAASTGSVDVERGVRLVTLMTEALPALSASPDKRKALVEEFQKAKGELATRVLVKWLENEGRIDTSKELAVVLTRMAPKDPDILQGYATTMMSAGRATAAVVLLRSAIEQSNRESPTTSQTSRQPDLKAALVRALLLERTADGLAEAENMASQELRLKPEDGQLLLLRGAVREALGRRFEAAEDLRRALKTEGAVMADPQRQEAERKTALLLLSEDPKKAKEFLDSLPPLPRDRDYLVVLGRVAFANEDLSQAIVHFRAALKAQGKDELNVVRYHLARALLASPRGEDRLEAKSLFEALEAEPPLPEGHPLQPLREDVRADAAARAAVRDLDQVPPDRVNSALATVLGIGHRSLPWLFHQLVECARTAPLFAVERRMTAARSIIAPTGPASKPAVLNLPDTDASREVWVDFATRAASWWDHRRDR